LVSDESPGTTFYKPQTEIEDVEGLAKLWGDMTDDLKEMFAHSVSDKMDYVRSKIKDFGNILHYPRDLKRATPEVQCADGPVVHNMKTKEGLLPRGTVVVSGARTVHAGPECHGYRAIIFFSASPPAMSDEEKYHTDTQFSGPALLMDMIIVLWEVLTVPQRIYLLHKVCDYVEAYRGVKNNSHAHFCEKAYPTYRQFLETVESKEWQSRGKEYKDSYIETFARTRGEKLPKAAAALQPKGRRKSRK
jgi:hypothetical protein